MIAATSRTLAELLSRELAQISQEDISFEHPRIRRSYRPGLNLYCYHVQEVELHQADSCRWFNLTFLVSVIDHTRLGEQNLLSNVFVMLSQYEQLPDTFLDCTLQGYGAVQIRVCTQAPTESSLLWTVLCAPLQSALHVTLTVPYYLPQQVTLVP
ncbi:Pvc16 family protein [Trichocoleus sp. FACHB-262]|uniref:Pvc16 family protein n=1 Tax=Trichocoleus sp. FACHB-262 TaxID=2692869 RepID=UPI001685D925|nr:Pvc16 family protein [Trichocoleus sp. FACHB-262]MBD2123522.1 DUF4255 domain-containing protein [Trichocoleus sp. FACHB-262]